jgi:flagellar biosynthesis protein FlhA
MTEHVRTRLMRQITFSNTTPDGSLNIVSLSPQWEQTFSQSLYGDGEVKQLAMNPSQLQEFINHVKTTFDKLILSGDNPVLVTSPPIRPYVRSVLERTRPSTIILSQSEVHPKVKIKTFGLL